MSCVFEYMTSVSENCKTNYFIKNEENSNN
jgi:hypothetical protein